MKSQSKVRVIPGRALTGRDIKVRLRNRTLRGEEYDNDAYTLDEDMVKFSRMSKVEKLTAMKENAKRIQQLQAELESKAGEKKRKLDEQKIEQLVQERMKKIANDQPQPNQK